METKQTEGFIEALRVIADSATTRDYCDQRRRAHCAWCGESGRTKHDPTCPKAIAKAALRLSK